VPWIPNTGVRILDTDFFLEINNTRYEIFFIGNTKVWTISSKKVFKFGGGAALGNGAPYFLRASHVIALTFSPLAEFHRCWAGEASLAPTFVLMGVRCFIGSPMFYRVFVGFSSSRVAYVAGRASHAIAPTFSPLAGCLCCWG